MVLVDPFRSVGELVWVELVWAGSSRVESGEIDSSTSVGYFSFSTIRIVLVCHV